MCAVQEGNKMRIALIIACIGHIICGITDCMLAYTPGGRFDFKKDTADPGRMKKLFEKMPLKQVELAMLIGVFAIFTASFGYIGLSRYAEQFSGVSGTIMYISALFFLVTIAAHHVLCGAVEWFYIKLGSRCNYRSLTGRTDTPTVFRRCYTSYQLDL